VATVPAAGLGDAGPAAAPRPGLLLDRDGTIIVDHGYVGSAIYLETDDYRCSGGRSFPSLAAAAPFILERVAV